MSVLAVILESFNVTSSLPFSVSVCLWVISSHLLVSYPFTVFCLPLFVFLLPSP